jgi:hypothetical protein
MNLMRRNRYLILGALLLALIGALSAPGKETGQIKPAPFESGEELVFVGEYTWFLIRGADIADLRMTILSQRDETTPAAEQQPAPARWRISAEAESRGTLSKLFGLTFHYLVESTVDPVSFSVLQTERQTEQSGRRVESKSVFDPTTGDAVWIERDLNKLENPPKTVRFKFNGGVQDIISVFYFARIFELTPGLSFEIPVSDWGTVYRVPVKVVEKKKLETALGEVTTARLEVGVFGPGRLLGREGEMTVWLTDDARHIPVRARLDFGLGRIEIKLKEMTNRSPAGSRRRPSSVRFGV